MLGNLLDNTSYLTSTLYKNYLLEMEEVSIGQGVLLAKRPKDISCDHLNSLFGVAHLANKEWITCCDCLSNDIMKSCSSRRLAETFEQVSLK